MDSFGTSDSDCTARGFVGYLNTTHYIEIINKFKSTNEVVKK